MVDLQFVRRPRFRSVLTIIGIFMVMLGCENDNMNGSASTWVPSEDGLLALRIIEASTDNEMLHIEVALRYTGEGRRNVLRPLVDTSGTWAGWIQLFIDEGPLPYYGPVADETLPASAFTTLSPDAEYEESLSVPLALYVGASNQKDIKFVFLYAPTESHRRVATTRHGLNDVWVGRIEAGPVRVQHR